MKLNYSVAFINDQARLLTLCENLATIRVLALDIETINWWNPPAERVALIQLAYRVRGEMRVSVIDALARLDLPLLLRPPLESHTTTKVIHNAVFDAGRIARHFKITTAPIHDTMLAARRSGEKRYSLKAQVEKYLNFRLDKAVQGSDWSVRPLQPKQLDYAARDAIATLLLFEHQEKCGLRGDYRLRADNVAEQGALPLDNSLPPARGVKNHTPLDEAIAQERRPSAKIDLSASLLALLGIITELPSRYSPERLAVCTGEDRVGLAGWIIDRVLGKDADLDESTAKMMIADLCGRGLVSITATRRLEASEAGRSIWQKCKPA